MLSSEASFSFCLCADDFALSPGVSRGILEAIGAGRLSAVSVMTTRPAWPASARTLRPFTAKADIGLHLNLTLGEPLGEMPSFAASGRLPEIHQVIKGARQKSLPEAEIEAEISRQLDHFSRHFGAPPAFIDGHQHVHVLPQIRSALFLCLERRDLAGKVWLRTSSDRPSAILRRGVEVAKALAVAWLGRGFAREAAARGFPTNEGIRGVFGVRSGARLRRRFRPLSPRSWTPPSYHVPSRILRRRTRRPGPGHPEPRTRTQLSAFPGLSGYASAEGSADRTAFERAHLLLAAGR